MNHHEPRHKRGWSLQKVHDHTPLCLSSWRLISLRGYKSTFTIIEDLGSTMICMGSIYFFLLMVNVIYLSFFFFLSPYYSDPYTIRISSHHKHVLLESGLFLFPLIICTCHGEGTQHRQVIFTFLGGAFHLSALIYGYKRSR